MSSNQGHVYRDTVSRGDAGSSVLAYHVAHFRHSDELTWRHSIEAGRVLLNGRRAGSDERLAAGDRLEFHRPPWSEPSAPLSFSVVLEDEHVDTLMELLPPVGWADVATKQDLDLKVDALESRTQAGFAGIRAEMAAMREELGVGLADLRTELHRELRQQLWAILGVLILALVISEAVTRIG